MLEQVRKPGSTKLFYMAVYWALLFSDDQTTIASGSWLTTSRFTNILNGYPV